MVEVKIQEDAGTHHVLPALHELLVDDLAGKVLAGLDVDSLFDDSIGAASEGFTCTVLEWRDGRFVSAIHRYHPTRHHT